MIAPEVAVKVNVKLLHLRGESLVSGVGHRGGLLVVAAFGLVVLEVLDGAVQLGFKHTDSLDGVLGDVLGEVGVEAANVVQVDVEARSLF